MTIVPEAISLPRVNDQGRRNAITEFLDQKLAEIRERLKEIAPLVDEYERLVAAEVALSRADSVVANSKPDAVVAQRAMPKQPQKRAGRGENKQKILTALTERPGATVGEVQAITGISISVLYSAMNRLKESGDVVMQPLPGGGNGYSVRVHEEKREELSLRIVTGGVPKVLKDSSPVYVTQAG